MELDHIVFDVEIANPIEERDGWLATDKLGVGCAVVYNYQSDAYDVYNQRHVDELRHSLLKADKISGFNIYKFDYPVVFGMTLKDWLKSEEAKILIPKTNDLLRRIWLTLGLDPMSYVKRSHGGWGLNAIATGTIGQAKIAEGKTAPGWIASGSWDYAVTYCMDDVRLTRDLVDFVDKYGYVVNGNTQKVLVV